MRIRYFGRSHRINPFSGHRENYEPVAEISWENDREDEYAMYLFEIMLDEGSWEGDVFGDCMLFYVLDKQDFDDFKDFYKEIKNRYPRNKWNKIRAENRDKGEKQECLNQQS